MISFSGTLARLGCTAVCIATPPSVTPMATTTANSLPSPSSIAARIPALHQDEESEYRQHAINTISPLITEGILITGPGARLPLPNLTLPVRPTLPRSGSVLFNRQGEWHQLISGDLSPEIYAERTVNLGHFLGDELSPFSPSFSNYFRAVDVNLLIASGSNRSPLVDVVRVLLNQLLPTALVPTGVERKIIFIYGLWLFSCLTVCSVGGLPDLANHQLQNVYFLRLMGKIHRHIRNLPEKVANMFQHLVDRQPVFSAQRVFAFSWLDVGAGEWRLGHVTELPFGVIHNASIGALNVDTDETEEEPITKARYYVEAVASFPVKLVVFFVAVLRAGYVFARSGLDRARARERYNSIMSGLQKWESDNVYLANGRPRTGENGSDVNIFSVGSLLGPREKRMLGSYANQGLVIYGLNQQHGDPQHASAPQVPERVRRFYSPSSAKTHLIGLSAKDAIIRLSLIRHVGDGGRISASAASLIVVWLYILLCVVTSGLAAIRNWGGRENILERFADSVWVITTLLISVFGILKLTSEDPNAIRHALSGHRMLLKPRDVYEYLCLRNYCDKAAWEEVLKGAVCMHPYALEWMSDHETSYAPVTPIGNMRLGGGLLVQTAVGFGLLPTRSATSGVTGAINTRLNKRFEVQRLDAMMHHFGESPWLQIDRRSVGAVQIGIDDIVTAPCSAKYK